MKLHRVYRVWKWISGILLRTCRNFPSDPEAPTSWYQICAPPIEVGSICTFEQSKIDSSLIIIQCVRLISSRECCISHQSVSEIATANWRGGCLVLYQSPCTLIHVSWFKDPCISQSCVLLYVIEKLKKFFHVFP